jgi:hypothetical protein
MAPAGSKRLGRRPAKGSTFLECDGITLRRAISLPPQLKTLDRGFVRMLRPHGRSRSGSAADRKLPRTDNAVLPTADRLRHDISRGATADKIDFPDPAAAPLGTDDEAAGRPNIAEERALEVAARSKLDPPTSQSEPGFSVPIFYAVLIVCIAALILLAAIMGR